MKNPYPLPVSDPNKTYAESEGRETFDWNDYIDRGRNGRLSSEEISTAHRLAQSWVTCACGNLCSTIPRLHPTGQPEDYDLRFLGMEFMDAIADNLWDWAAVTLAAIENRSAEILAKQ